MHYIQASEDFFRDLERSLRDRITAVAEKARSDAADERDRIVRDQNLSENNGRLQLKR